MPVTLQYQIRQPKLILEYEKFITRWGGNERRLPTVMYFRSVLSEIRPDVRDIVDEEMLRFYSDYPFADNNSDWRDLFEEFPESPESIEARWRIAMDEARKRNFDVAEEICQTAQIRIDELLENPSGSKPEESNSIFSAFQQPEPPVMTSFKLQDLRVRFRKLQSLISEENKGDEEESKKRLAEFLMLNPYDRHSYAVSLDGLLQKMSLDDGLRDNILLEKAMLTDDIQRRSQLLEELAGKYPQRDAGIRAQYEWGMTKIRLWKDQETSEDEKRRLLTDARQILSDFVEEHPECPFAQQVREMLQTLPQ